MADGADERLRYFHERDMRAGSQTVKEDGLWEEYRYDPLGRRVLVNTRTASLCRTQSAFQCASATTRMVWAGDQLLWEIRRSSESPGETAGPPAAYGTVSYTHGGGIDRPLVITKDGQSILPHQNWRGQFSRGTYANGTSSDCAPGQTSGCQRIAWPGWRTTAWHFEVKEPTISVWFGGLVDDMRDATGQMYKRNRYYDPATGQFTQQDPIGIAGGLNTYGFAAGDPVTYHDPYGLTADTVFVGRRHLDGTLGAVGDHAAVRVKTANSDQVGELLKVDGKNYIAVWNAGVGGMYPTGKVHTAADYEWTAVATPNGMTDEQFSAAVVSSFNEVGGERRHKDYSFAGARNSNNFVWSVIRRAGGSMPNIHKPGRVMPGVCGGRPLFPFQPGFGCP